MNTVLGISKKITKPNEKFTTKFKKCYLCGEWLNPYTSNTDHVIPKAKEGLDVNCNKKLVHTRCNYMKRDSLDETLLSNIKCIKADTLLGINEKSKVRAILIRKAFPEINLSKVTDDDIIRLKDYLSFESLCKTYKLKINKIFEIGYVPINSKVLKYKPDFTLTEKEIAIVTNHLVYKINFNIA